MYKFVTTSYGRHFNLEDLKNSYDYAENYDSSKTYNTETFTENYIGSPYTYQFHLYVNGDNNFVVAHRIFTDDELKPLEQYCNCPYCSRSWYNLTRYCYCKCCYGCIQAGVEYASEHRIKYALSKVK
jgi:hypothetical protein